MEDVHTLLHGIRLFAVNSKAKNGMPESGEIAKTLT